MESEDEFSVIRDFFSDFSSGRSTIVGPGDDCAVLKLPKETELATSSDTMIQGTHFPRGSAGSDVAYRAIATSASDLAAIGARPLASVLSLSLPAIDRAWLRDFSDGLSLAINHFALPLVGGDLTFGHTALTTTVYGFLPAGQALLRSGAQEDDLILVSGTLGDAAAGLGILQDEWELDGDASEYLIRRFYRPSSRLELGARLLEVATAAIDISDGLLADAGHISLASGVALEIDANKVPLSSVLSKTGRDRALSWALSGGDDYELCFTLPKNEKIPTGCTPIGVVKSGTGVNCLGFDVSSIEKGYRHFS